MGNPNELGRKSMALLLSRHRISLGQLVRR
jgi:hypothetical protein